MATIENTAELIDQPAHEYHADTMRVSHSMLKVFHESPRLYHGRFVTGEYPAQSSDALDFGTAAHAMLLEDRSVYVPIPRDVLNADGHKKGKAWTDFAKENTGKILLTADQQSTLNAMVAEIRRHPAAMKLLNCRGDRERVIHWDDEATGINHRAMVDILPESMAFVADYKTTDDASRERIASRVYDFRYHTQADLYCEAVAALTGKRPQFLFVFQQKSPPYTVRVMPLSGEYLAVGRIENRQDRDSLARCIEDDYWDDDYHGRLEPHLEAPHWVIKKAL